MNDKQNSSIKKAKEAAIKVLHHNLEGPFQRLPRTAGWGYPEPYTRDLMISAFGILLSKDLELIDSIRRVLISLSNNQSKNGHIPSLVHDSTDRGASDTTPLFLICLALFRKTTGENRFLNEASEKALTWMQFQSPDDSIMVAQQPTSDWRDEQWVYGYGLYVNTLVYIYLRLYGFHKQANSLRNLMNQIDSRCIGKNQCLHEGFGVLGKPYYALWTYKIHNSERFDLLGNSLAILSGISTNLRSNMITNWIETECKKLKEEYKLAMELPPNFFPYIKPTDTDWHLRYAKYNLPGYYHNGGIWPYICGFYVGALVASNEYKLAEKKLNAFTNCVKQSKDHKREYGFNEWIRAQDGKPMGQDWQTWSASMYLYATYCVEKGETPFFEEMRNSEYI